MSKIKKRNISELERLIHQLRQLNYIDEITDLSVLNKTINAKMPYTFVSFKIPNPDFLDY